jgi:two-component system, OmpR family, sensor histidine kinase KdpD
MSRLLGRSTRYGYLLAVVAIAFSTALFLAGRDTFAKDQWALLYLLLVVLVAGASGTGPAILAAVLAFFAWDFFFLPPYLTLAVNDSKDWLSLLVLLAVGVAMGVQTGRMRDREAQALAREHETAALNRLSAGLVSQASTAEMAETILGEIVGLLGATSATLFVGDDERLTTICVTPQAGEPDSATTTVAHWVYTNDAPVGLPRAAQAQPIVVSAQGETVPGEAQLDIQTPSEGFRVPEGSGGVFLPLRSTTGVVGVLSVAGRVDKRAYDDDESRLLASIANLVAAFLERQQLQGVATAAEALREADRLKSSLLSSVSHELKTPLAALTATVSNLLEGDVPWNEKSVRDELRAIVSDVARLNNSIGALLDLSRLEARAWEPHRELYELSDILVTSLDALPVHQRGRVTITLPDDLPPLRVDFVQWVRVFQNLLENAVLYAGASQLLVGAQATAGSLRMWVQDEGPGIPEEEHEAVFEKFFRGHKTGQKAPSGTGLGLAITREIVRAHGGTVHIEDVAPHGARFVIDLPNDMAENQESRRASLSARRARR